MSKYRGIYLTRAPLPDPETQARWKCEAIRLGFPRSVVLRLCWARWYWRDVQGLGPMTGSRTDEPPDQRDHLWPACARRVVLATGLAAGGDVVRGSGVVSRYTGQDIAERAIRLGASPELARIMGAAAMSEGGGNSDAVGDNGESIGAFQINDINGLTGDQRRDLDFATRWMLEHEFQRAYTAGRERGYTDEELARWTCMAAERPYGWHDQNRPGLDSPAADGYAAWWHAIEEPTMPTTRTYDPSTPRVAQTDPFSCSCATTTWMLQSIGEPVTYPEIEAAMIRDGLVTPELGLLDGSGGALMAWLHQRLGIPTGGWAQVPWEWLQEHAGTVPIGIGGAGWYHWVGVRSVDGDGNLLLANPAEGYKSIWDRLTEADFQHLGPFAAVCIYVYAPTEEDPEVIAELQQQIADAQSLLGAIQHDWADAVESAINDAKTEPNKAKRNADLDAALAALATIRNGG